MLIVSENPAGETTPNPHTGQPMIHLSYLYEGTKKVLDQAAKTCGMQGMRPPPDARKFGGHYCPRVYITDENPCDGATGLPVFSTLVVIAISIFTLIVLS